MLNLNCVICAELFIHSDDVHVTHCGHMFHYACLQQWLERSKTCPQCRNRCNDRNIFRVYFNLANLDVSAIDVGSLQEQLDNANLQIKLKDSELHKLEDKIKSLKESQKKCLKTISGLEEKLHKNDFVILSYTEQIKLLKSEAKLVEDMRRQVKDLKNQIETMDGVSSILVASTADAEMLLKNERDPKKLSVWVTTLKRELRHCESKKIDMRNVLKVVQNDLRKEIELKRAHEERISQLESENYQLNEKLKSLAVGLPTGDSVTQGETTIGLNTNLLANGTRNSVSPSIKENIKKIEDSNSPYLNIKSSSVGLVPLFKRNLKPAVGASNAAMQTTTKLATLTISPSKCGKNDIDHNKGAVRKTVSDMSEKYSIFKKPRLVMIGPGSGTRLLRANYAYNGFGGSEKVDPFERLPHEELEVKENVSRAPDGGLIATTAVPQKINLNARLKTGGLRNFKLK